MLPSFAFTTYTALMSIGRHKVRSFLTMLSIIIGVATVIATVAIGRGAQEKIRERLMRMGTNALFIQAGAPRGLKIPQHVLPLTVDDVRFLRTFDPRIVAVSGICRYKETPVTYKLKQITAPIVGVDEAGLMITNNPLAYGRPFVAGDIHAKTAVAIIAPETAEALFGHADPLGKVLHIDGTAFSVIGVLARTEEKATTRNANQEIYLPLSSAKKAMGSAPHRVTSIALSIDTRADINQVERLIRRALRARHQLVGEEPDDFTVWNQASMIAAAEQSSQTLNLFLLIVASLSLLVGGLGVSNIMFVTVSERTQEIGIRMALGASPAAILLQFLCESIVLCLIGALIGTSIGISMPYALSFFVDWCVIISPTSVLISIFTTALLGLFFGFWPALRAARLPIVQALNDQ